MDGILLFNKPILWTSHDAVDFIRLKLGQKKVGHAGTLDPMATGLLLILIGKATKLSLALSALDKDYFGTMKLGVTTDTQDLEGRIVAVAETDEISEGAIDAVFEELRGSREQVIPMYSAARKNGKKLYEWARKGVCVEEMTKPVTISTLKVNCFALPEIHFFMTCSKGTYVRSVCDLAGKKLGCGAALSSLVRSRIGNFKLENAIDEKKIRNMPPADIEQRLIKPSVVLK